MSRKGGVKWPDRHPHLAVFDTFKTRTDQLTGEAKRQRAIISILASKTSPADNTRTAIAHAVAHKNDTPWKNIYSGIFKDFDEVLVPLGIVEEKGRLPLKRGPKALQEKGIPYYQLTEKGIIAALSIQSEKRADLLKQLVERIETDIDPQMLEVLLEIAPNLLYTIFERYVQGYCKGKIKELTPFSIENVRITQGETWLVYKELLAMLAGLSKENIDILSKFLDSISKKME